VERQCAFLKNCTSRSCFSVASREPNVPRFLRLPVLASAFLEYRRYSPVFSFRIIPGSEQVLVHPPSMRVDAILKAANSMGALRDVEDLLPSLTRAEKAQLLRIVVQDLDDAFPGIESTAGICGGEPCIVRTRIPVWTLEQARRLGVSEENLLREYPVLRAEDLANAWAYVRSHPTEIEDQIRDNESAAFFWFARTTALTSIIFCWNIAGRCPFVRIQSMR